MSKSLKITTITLFICLICGTFISVIALAKKNTAEEEKELRIVTVGSSSDKAIVRIENLLNEILEDELGVKIKIIQYSRREYNEKLSQNLLLNNDFADMFCYIGTDNLMDYSRRGYISQLNNLIDDSDWLENSVPRELWLTTSVNGKTFAVPSRTSLNYSVGFYARRDILDALGVAAGDIKDIEDLHRLLIKVKENYPDMVGVVPNYGYVIETMGQDPLGDNLGVLIGNDSLQVENLYSSEIYSNWCHRMRKWYMQGLILENAPLTNDAATTMLKAYDGFGFFAKVNNYNTVEYTRLYGDFLEPIRLDETISNTSSSNIGWCISSKSDLREEAFRLLEAMYSRKQIADIWAYGEEETDYERIDSTHVTDIDNETLDLWETERDTWPNYFVNSSWVMQNGEDITTFGEIGARRSPAMGFMFDSTFVEMEENYCKTIVDRYDMALVSGFIDCDVYLDQFNEKLEEAGLSNIIVEKQRQIDKWTEDKKG